MSNNIIKIVKYITDNNYELVTEKFLENNTNIKKDLLTFYNNDFETYQYSLGLDSNKFLYIINLSNKYYKDKFINTFCQNLDKKNFEEKFLFTFDSEEDLFNLYPYIQDFKINKKNIIAKQKKELFNTLRNSALYINGKDYFEIDMLKDYNYLEYYGKDITVENNIFSSKTYEVSIYDLVKIYIFKGNLIFNGNVRYGLNKKNLRDPFYNIIRNKINQSYNSLNDSIKNCENFLNHFEIDKTSDNSYENDMNYNFFFAQHNGVTIIFKNTDFDYNGNILKFKSDADFSIVNGAQTITVFTEIYIDYLSIIDKNFKDSQKDKKKLQEFIDNIFKNLTLKLNIISLKDNQNNNSINIDEISTNITIGLNTQNNVKSSETSIAEVSDINNIIDRQYNFKIIKPGEYKDLNSIDSLGFVKRFLCFMQEPGNSKNFNSSDFKKQIKKISTKIKKSNKGKTEFNLNLTNYIKRTNYILDHFVSVISDNYPKDDKKLWFCKNSTNYFISYIKDYVIKLESDISNDELLYLFEQYYKIIEDNNIRQDPQIFKNDKCFEEYFKNTNDSNNDEQSNKLYIEELEKLLNEPSNIDDYKGMKSKNKRNLYVTEIAKEIIGDLDDFKFKTIKCTKENNQINVTEHMSLSTTTFTSLVDNVLNDSNRIKFDKSVFYKEIKDEFNLVIEIECDDKTSFEIIEVNLRNDDKVIENAEKVFNYTYDKIINGDSDFTKAKDECNFHIKPHAANKYDGIEYTDGSQITKQSFWINKETLNNIINSKEHS